MGTATTHCAPADCGQMPEAQKGLLQVCAHRTLYCPGGYCRYPVLSPLQEDEQFLLPFVEDGNLSHGMRFCWDSFLVPPNHSTPDC